METDEPDPELYSMRSMVEALEGKVDEDEDEDEEEEEEEQKGEEQKGEEDGGGISSSPLPCDGPIRRCRRTKTPISKRCVRSSPLVPSRFHSPPQRHCSIQL
jgi:hypothetical protein